MIEPENIGSFGEKDVIFRFVLFDYSEQNFGER